MGKVKKIGIGVIVILVALIIGMTFLPYTPTIEPIEPNKFRFFFIKGGPEEGNYTVSFALQDAEERNGPADGKVILKIIDDDGKVLCESERMVKVSDYSKLSVRVGSDVLFDGIGCSWNITISDVMPGRYAFGFGKAYITFATTKGDSFSAVGPFWPKKNPSLE